MTTTRAFATSLLLGIAALAACDDSPDPARPLPGGVFVRRWDAGGWTDLGSNIVIDPDGTRQTQDSSMQVIGTDLFLAFTELEAGVYSLWVLRRAL